MKEGLLKIAASIALVLVLIAIANFPTREDVASATMVAFEDSEDWTDMDQFDFTSIIGDETPKIPARNPARIHVDAAGAVKAGVDAAAEAAADLSEPPLPDRNPVR